MSTRSGVIALLKRDKRYCRLLDALNDLPLYQVPHDRFEKEVLGIHSCREARRLNPDDAIFIEKLNIAVSQEVGHRSRVSEIKMSALRAKMSIERAMSKLRDYYLLEYTEHLKNFRTKDERLMIIEAVMRQFYDYVNNAERLMALCDIVIQDIDKAYWSLKLVSDNNQQHRAPERNI